MESSVGIQNIENWLTKLLPILLICRDPHEYGYERYGSVHGTNAEWNRWIDTELEIGLDKSPKQHTLPKPGEGNSH
jgi:hypothetical protein